MTQLFLAPNFLAMAVRKRQIGKAKPKKESKGKNKGDKASKLKRHMTDAQRVVLKKRFIKQMSDNMGIISYACTAVGISRKTYYNWRDSDADFKDAVEEIEEKEIDFVHKKLLENIRKDNVAAQIFYLKTKGKDRGYSETTHLTLSGKKGGVPIAVESIKEEFSDEALTNAVANILAKKKEQE